MTPNIVWLRQDLRLEDNPALWDAAKHRHPILPIYIFDTENPGKWQIGGAQKWWLHYSLNELKHELSQRGIPLILRKGSPHAILSEVVAQTGAAKVFWNRCYEPFALKRDKAIEKELKEKGVEVNTYNGSLLVEPWEAANKSGSYFKVFTQFWNFCLKALDPSLPLPAPELVPSNSKLSTDLLEEWGLIPKHPDWASQFKEVWKPGERHAKDRLKGFINNALKEYFEGRDFPGTAGTSLLSPHLHMGEISPRTIWHAVKGLAEPGSANDSKDCYLREIGWREFSYHLLYHFKELPESPFNPKFRSFPWKRDASLIRKWQKGQTGYPIVDAGMRQLWHIGWMHNRVRMIAASFLTKDLLIPWQEGEMWFWDTLVDADLASNSASWQWVAGCGADAQPYFRIFNPVLQGEKFDPEGTYIKRWVPELKHLPSKYIHKPWEAPREILEKAGIFLGKNYPEKIVDHSEARKEALALFKQIKK